MVASNPNIDYFDNLESLSSLYQLLNESDLYETLWKRRSYYEETNKILALMNQGEFYSARKLSEKHANSEKVQEKVQKMIEPANMLALAAPSMHDEAMVWEETWIE